MKRFLSMLATLVLVGQSVVTPAVYAMQGASENEESVSEAVVETTIDESDADDGSSDDEVIADVDDSTNDAEESAGLEETADAEESVKAEDSDTLEDSKTTEDAETSEVVETEKAEETVAEETSAEDVEESSIEEPVSYGKSFSSEQQEKSWTEISENRLVVTAIDSLGAFPEGTKMVVKAVEEEHVFDLVNDAIDANVTKVRAVDITFWHDGEEVQPEQPINVKISALNMSELQTVVHVDAEYNDEKIEVGDVDVEEINSEINGKTAEFEAESFSIYAIVTYPVLTVNLYNNGADNDPVVINVKNEGEISSLIYDPGVENLGDKVFRGWIAENSGYTAVDAGSGLTIANIRTEALEKFGGLEAGGKATLNYYAMVFNQYTVTYYDERLAVIQTDEKLFTEEFGTKVPYTISAQYTAEEGKNFMGWTPIKESETTIYENGTGITLTGNLELYVSLHEGNWLIFNENGKGATYNAPRFVETDDFASTVMPANNPERLGYVFGGWYKDKDCTAGNEFNFDVKLNSNTTIYAKWTANETADYTVIIWKQNVDGDGYDFGEAIHLKGTVNTPITSVEKQGQDDNAYARVNGENKQYTGFHLKEFDQDVNIAPEGSSVLHVYYDRNEYTLTFQVYNGRSRNIVRTITALYGTKINNQFPIPGYENYIWKSQNSNTFGDLYIVNADIMPAENVTFRGQNAGSAYRMEYYVQPTSLSTDYSDYELVNTITAYNSSFFLTYEEDFMEMAGFIRAGSSPSFNREGQIEHQGWGTMTVKFYYNRAVYPINFMDGIYVDGDGKPVEESNRGQLKVLDNVSFGADLSSYNKGGDNYYKPEYNGFVFEGRYIDEACTHAYTFDKMPQGGVTVYAKWRQKQYRVFLHPNVPEDGLTIDWGTGQAMNFRVSNGEKVSVPEGRINGYEFAGWYTDEALKNLFYGDTPLNDTTVTTPYDKTVDMTDPMDEFGNIGSNPYNSDLIGYNGKDRFRITTKLDLYAKWRSTLEGASGMNIIYDANGGTNAPEDTSLYTDQAEAVAQSASTPSDNTKQFKYWVVQKPDGDGFVDTAPEVKVYPGERFVVLKSYAKAEDITPEGSEEIKMKYTVKLRAEYGDIEKAEPTSIEYYNGDELVYTWTGNVNEEFTFAEALTEAGNEFLGWTDGTHIYTGGSTGYAADNEGIKEGGANILNAKWKCENGEHLDGDVCVAKATRSCTPDENLEAGWINVENPVQVEWNGRDWGTPAPCDKVCNKKQDYHDYNGACVKEVEKECKPNDAVEGWIDIPGKIKVSWDDLTDNWAEVTKNCEKACDTTNGYHPDGDNCVKEKVDKCKIPENKDNNAIYTETGSYTRSGNAWEAPECTIVGCENHYVLNEAKNECVLASHTLTIKYIYVDGGEAAKTYTDTLNYGSEYEVTSPEVPGYTPDVAVVKGTMGDEKVEVTVTYTANEDTAYKVEYRLKNLNAETYTLKETVKTGGTTNEEVRAEIKTYEGFTFSGNHTGNVLVGTIAADGSLVLKVYYDRDTYIVTFDETGVVCEYGDTVAVPREIPTKTGNAQYSYTFAGWKRVDGTVLASGTTEVICENVTYEPTFDETVNKYTIKFVDEDGTELQSSEVAYGETPVYTGKEPTKETDAQYTYAFSGWTPEIVAVTESAVYTATYTGTYIDYTVIFDNTGVQCHYGERVPVPTYIPTKDSDETYTYEFAGWKIVNSETTSQAVMSGDVDCENIEYESTFKGTYIEYSVKWIDGNTELSGAVYHYNDSIVKLANPIKSGYVFSGWNPEVAEKVTGDAIYVAEWNDDKNNNEIDDATELVAITFKAGDHGKLEKGTTGYTTEKTLLPGYDKYPAAPSTTADNGWEFNGWSPSYKAGEKIPLSGAELEYTAQRKQKSNPGGGGGGGSPTTYECKNLPANAEANNSNRPSRNTDYTYSEEKDALCTFHCKSGYTRDKDNKKCTKSQQPGNGGNNDEDIEFRGQVSDKCSVDGSNRSEEEKAAYLYACENDITTIRDIEKARLGDFLTRAEMAKMISVFATKELGMKPNTSKDCSNFANSIASYNQEMKDYMVMSCQLELMGIHTVDYKAIPDFMPSKRVSRAEFGTVLSRVLWGNKYEGTNSNYYINHLNALKENNIITNINPHITEYRAWVFLMLYRSVEAIKILKASNNETVEQQVNEELQEEGKAETGLVVEYDSGSVVPDMATVTESGTLATGAVAEVETGSVAEAQTGDTVSTTGDIAKQTAKVETGDTNN